MIGFYMLLGLSLNLITGYIGGVSLGHAAFYAVGAFSVSLLTTDAGWGYWPSVFVAVVICMALGAVLSYATMRVSGTYLAILTLAFFYLTMNLIQNMEWLTHGAVGIYDIPAPTIFNRKFTLKNGMYYYCILAYILLLILVTSRLINSRFGRAMKAFREDSMASTMVGIKNQSFRTMAYVIAAAFAGLAGTLYGPFLGYINYLSFNYDMCLMTLVIVIFGGRGTIKGTVVGALIIAPMGELLRGLVTFLGRLDIQLIKKPDKWRFVIYGIILVLVMQLRPQGLLGGKSKLPYKFPRGVKVKDKEGTNGIA